MRTMKWLVFILSVIALVCAMKAHSNAKKARANLEKLRAPLEQHNIEDFELSYCSEDATIDDDIIFDYPEPEYGELEIGEGDNAYKINYDRERNVIVLENISKDHLIRWLYHFTIHRDALPSERLMSAKIEEKLEDEVEDFDYFIDPGFLYEYYNPDFRLVIAE